MTKVQISLDEAINRTREIPIHDWLHFESRTSDGPSVHHVYVNGSTTADALPCFDLKIDNWSGRILEAKLRGYGETYCDTMGQEESLVSGRGNGRIIALADEIRAKILEKANPEQKDLSQLQTPKRSRSIDKMYTGPDVDTLPEPISERISKVIEAARGTKNLRITVESQPHWPEAWKGHDIVGREAITTREADIVMYYAGDGGQVKLSISGTTSHIESQPVCRAAGITGRGHTISDPDPENFRSIVPT